MQLSKALFIKLQSSVDFFKSFTAGELLALLKLAKSEPFQKDEVIFKEGTRGDKMYIILNGAVRISRPIGGGKEEVLVTLQPGACFGEMGVIDQSPRSARATADQPNTILLSLSAGILSEQNVLLAFKLYRNFSVVLAGRVRETNDKLQSATENERTGNKQVRDMLKKKLEGGGSMEGANFKGVDLSEVFMNNANFHGCNLVGAKLQGVKAKQTNFTQAKFVASQITDNVFEEGNFQEADFSGAVFRDVTFKDCDLKSANFMGADLTGAQLDQLAEVKDSPPNKSAKN